jgi:hypothetical protein
MTLIELLWFLIPVLLSSLLWGTVLWRYGLWGVIAAVVLGIGVWVALWAILNRALNKRARGKDIARQSPRTRPDLV